MLIDRYRAIPALLDAVALEHNSPERQLEVAHNCGAKRIVLRNSFAFRLTAAGRHVREVANTRGKSPSREGEHRWADSPRRGRLRQIGLRPPTFLWRRFSRLLLVNGAANGTTEPRGLLGVTLGRRGIGGPF